MADIKIEKNIPFPPSKRAARSKWPFEKMEINDSFAVPTNGKLKAVRARVGSAITSRRKACPKENYATRMMLDGDQIVIRVWRLQDIEPPEG